MMYLRWALLAPLSLAFNVFVMLTAPLWAAWAALGNLYVLPGVFAYVHTHDASIYGPIQKPKGAVLLEDTNPRERFDKPRTTWCVSTNHDPRIPRDVLCGMLTCEE